MTSRNLAYLVYTPTKKKAPTGNKSDRPKATEVIAKTKHKVDHFFQRKVPQINADMPIKNLSRRRNKASPMRTPGSLNSLLKKKRSRQAS